MRRSQRVALTAAAATSVIGGAGAALALEPSSPATTDATQSVVLDAQAAHKKELRVALTQWKEHNDSLMSDLRDARHTLDQAQAARRTAMSQAAAQAVAAQTVAPAAAPQQQPATTTSAVAVAAPAPTTHTTTGASGAGAGSGEREHEGGSDD